jgi:hypothetical protein
VKRRLQRISGYVKELSHASPKVRGPNVRDRDEASFTAFALFPFKGMDFKFPSPVGILFDIIPREGEEFAQANARHKKCSKCLDETGRYLLKNLL